MLWSIIIKLLRDVVLLHWGSSVKLVAVLLCCWCEVGSRLCQQRSVIGLGAWLGHIRPGTRGPWRHYVG